MRIPDRYWWLQRAAGIAVAVFAAAFAVWSVTNTFQVLPYLGNDEISRTAEVAACAVAGGILLMFAQAIFTIRGSFRSHDRYRRRLAALLGERDAVPQADIAVHAENAPDVAAEPLELMWHPTHLSQRAYSILYIATCVVLGGLWLLPLYLIYLLATTKPIHPFTLDLTTVVSVGVVAIGLIMLLAAPPLLIGRIVQFWPADARGRPYGVSAGVEDIEYVPRVGRRQLIRWEDMWLLEVTTRAPSPLERRSYRLYGRDAIAEWDDAPPSALVMVGTMGMTLRELTARHQTLLDLIAARTGLTPRTFDTARRGRGSR